jgi:hypothetical protein
MVVIINDSTRQIEVKPKKYKINGAQKGKKRKDISWTNLA